MEIILIHYFDGNYFVQNAARSWTDHHGYNETKICTTLCANHFKINLCSPGFVGVVCNGTGGLRPPVPLPTAMEGRATARLTMFGAILYA